jgi:glycosyltransferase involved in cell wall biosynthesis
MREVCAHLETVPRVDPAKGTLRFYADAARHVIDSIPYAVAKYRSAGYRAALDHQLATGSFDALVCDFLVPVVNLPDRLPCRTILFTHNVEAEIWRRHADAASNPIAKRLLAQQWSRMLRFEGDALSRFDLVLAVSDVDRDTFERLYPHRLRTSAHVVQTGVDTDYFTPSNAAPTPGRMVFTGSMDWLPNEDAMVYFCREILPRIRQAEPAASLSIVGRAPTPGVRKLAEDHGVQVTGRVDDVRPHVAEASVYVVPLRIGGGTRLKIFEAMSMGKAVVSTAIGAEGLPVSDGHDIVISDDPARFADAVVRLMRDAQQRTALEHAARRLMVDHYDWSAVAEDFDDALAGTAAERQAVRAIA